MAAASRCGSALLSRASGSLLRPPAAAPARAFSTSLALRLGSSDPHRKPQSSEAEEPYVNPLVGNYPAPKRPVPARTPRSSWLSSRPAPASAPGSRAQAPAVSDPRSSRAPPPRPPPSSPPPLPPYPPALPAATAATAATGYGQAQSPSRPSGSTASQEEFSVYDIIYRKADDYAVHKAVADPLDFPKVHTKAVTGRTIFVVGHFGPTAASSPSQAIYHLDKMCREQKVRSKFHSQKFHERPGLRRKRLKSQRWRARFKTGFKATVSRILELKSQGW